MMTIYLSKDDAISLKYEWIPLSAKVQLTRLLDRYCPPHVNPHTRIPYLQRIVNRLFAFWGVGGGVGMGSGPAR